MKVISLVCESMQWCDIENMTICGTNKIPFDMKPARFSAQSLWFMQSDITCEFDVDDCHDVKKSLVFETDKLISHKHKTRLIANWWPARFNPRSIDPLAVNTEGKQTKVVKEPEAWQYPVLLDFLKKEFYNSDYKWLIYWSTIGHVECSNCRHPTEQGVPVNISKTATEWLTLINQQILPLVQRDTVILIHGDHNSGRRDCKNTNGFILHTMNVSFRQPAGWKEYREVVRSCLSSGL